MTAWYGRKNPAGDGLTYFRGGYPYGAMGLSQLGTHAIEGWLAYGASLNEGRALFPSDEQFGQWVDASVNDKLSVTRR